MVLKDGDGGIGHVTGDDGGYGSWQKDPYVVSNLYVDIRLAIKNRRFADSQMARMAGVTLLVLLTVAGLYTLILLLR